MDGEKKEIEYINNSRTKESEINCYVFYDDSNNKEIRIYYVLESGEIMFFCIRRWAPLAPHKEEMLLMILLNEEVKIIPDHLVDLKLIHCFANWGIPIKSGDLKFKLLRLYFASYDNFLEKIAKTDLHHIFLGLIDGRIVGIEKSGKTVGEILGVNIRILRAMDSVQGVEFLRTPDQRRLISRVYCRYHGLITNTKLLPLQIEYLLRHNGEKITLRKIESLVEYSDKEKELLDTYNLKRQSVLEYYPDLPMYVPRSKLEHFNYLVKSLEYMVENESCINEVLAKRLKDHSFEGDYVILSTVMGFTKTSSSFSNCLFRYPVRVGFSDCEIVVIVLPKAEICMELRQVQDTYIFVQALTKYNKPPNEKQTLEILRFLNQNKKIKII